MPFVYIYCSSKLYTYAESYVYILLNFKQVLFNFHTIEHMFKLLSNSFTHTDYYCKCVPLYVGKPTFHRCQSTKILQWNGLHFIKV